MSEEKNDFKEDILCENREKSRYVLFPIRYPLLYNMYEKHISTFWSVSEVDMEQDALAFEALSKNEQKFADLVNEKIDGLSAQIEAARHDLFNVMLDINGIHSAEDAQKSLDSLERSIVIIRNIKKIKVNGN